MTYIRKKIGVLPSSLSVTPAACERPSPGWQIIEISRVGPGTTQRERGAERLTVMREMMAEVSLDPGRVMSSIVLPRQRLFIQT